MAFDNWGFDGGVKILSESEKQIRKSFVTEYLKDYDALSACIRIGYESTFAKTYSVQFMQEPFTLNLILEEQRRKRTKEEDADERHAVLRITVNSLKEVAQRGGDRARVGACKLLTELYGVEEDLRMKTAVSSGVMIVPGIADVSTWEKEAMTAQSQLMKDSG